MAQLNAGPLWEKINKELITAEAAVRIACRKYGGSVGGGGGSGGGGEKGKSTGGGSEGACWWLERELQEKKERYGGRKLEGK